MTKIALIGAGNIGGVLAYLSSVRELGDIILIDKKPGLAKAKALDICQASSIYGFKCRILGTENPKAMRNADVVVISAGVPRRPDQKRDDLIQINKKIITEISQNIKEYAPNAFVIIITNPLDAMIYLAKKVTGFPRERIVGMAGILDSARLISFLAEGLGAEKTDINTIVIGGHNDSMVPVISRTTVKGKPVTEILSKESIRDLVERTKHAGAEIVDLMGTSAFFAPATGAINIAESYLKDEKRVFPCSVFLEGEYDLKDICIGVPVKIGKKGVEQIVQLDLTDEEKGEFNNSVQRVRELIEQVKYK
ncbi:malate dehydrogenase [Candidatus Woesearchaeota archaeon]|nr:malate dehydrogenase [Candidatus Woesearchaeota archaeon]